ncbi:Rho GTPase activating protein [Marasmius crinis-equi]|uniref:Rho GTPase activating protein n=1 Tax=Marasmius crinis-equi TaxID=585013 RepID=A0ABR3ES13_9AGAR
MHALRRPKNKAEFEQELAKVEAIIEDPQKRKELVETTGDDAQEWLDLLQLLVEYPGITETLRSSLFKIMIHLSRNSRLHPKCLAIQNVVELGDHPEAGGAFGDVWKGKVGGNLVCIKMIRAFSTFDIEQLLRDYMQEAIVWRQLNHRNLLPFMGIFYFDNDRKRLCLVSPWMERGNLVQFLRNSPPELVDRDMLVCDVACGLSYLHELKIAHGDLKGPKLNHYLRRKQAVRGGRSGGFLRKCSNLDQAVERPKKATSMLTAACATRYGYLSLTQNRLDGFCWKIFAGHVPFLGLSDPAVLFAVLLNDERPARPEGLPQLHDSLWNMIVACWDVDPSSRPTMVDVSVRLAAMNAEQNRMFEPASEWDNPRYTQIWNDIHDPTLLLRHFPAPPLLSDVDYGGTKTREVLSQKEEIERWPTEEERKRQAHTDKEIQLKRREEPQRELEAVKRPAKEAAREHTDAYLRQQEQPRMKRMAIETRSTEGWKREVGQKRKEQKKRTQEESSEDGGARDGNHFLNTNRTVNLKMPSRPASNIPSLAVLPLPTPDIMETVIPPASLQLAQHHAMLQATPRKSSSHHRTFHNSPQPSSTIFTPSYPYQYPNPARKPQELAPPFPEPRSLQSSEYPGNRPIDALRLLSSDLLHTKISVFHSSCFDDHGKEALSVIVHVDPGRGKKGWKVEKMYIHVLGLDLSVRASREKLGNRIPTLPGKTLWKGHSPTKVDQRKTTLENYFQTLINLPVKNNDEVIAFFTTDIVKESMQPAMQAVHKEGYLTKRGKKFGGWKTLYFVLRCPLLEYFDCRGGTRLGLIYVTGAQVGRRQQHNLSSASTDSENEYRHAFFIVEAKRGAGSNHPLHLFCAESNEERDSWVEILVRYCSGTYSEDPVTNPSQLRPGTSNDGSGAPKKLIPTMSQHDVAISKGPAIRLSQLTQDVSKARFLQAVPFVAAEELPKSSSPPKVVDIPPPPGLSGSQTAERILEQEQGQSFGLPA